MTGKALIKEEKDYKNKSTNSRYLGLQIIGPFQQQQLERQCYLLVNYVLRMAELVVWCFKYMAVRCDFC